MKLRRQVEQLAHAYRSKGGKDNRRQQAARMMAFAAHAEGLGAVEMGQVGDRHVVAYWKDLRASGGLANTTLYSHWLAIRELWSLAGKPGEPPRPFKTGEQPAGGARPEEGGGAQPTGGRGAAGPAVGGFVSPPLGGT